MLKQLKVSVFAAALAGVSLLSMGCTWGGGWLNGWTSGWNKLDNWPRIITAILREDLFS